MTSSRIMNEILPDRTRLSLKARAVKSAGINIASQFIAFVAHTVGVIVLARLLTPKDFGLVAMVTAFSIWLMNFGLNGFTEFIIQKEQISKREVSAIFWTHVILSLLLAFGFTGCGFLLVDFYNEPDLKGISIAMSTSFVFYALFTSHFALLKREMKFGLIAIVQLVAMILSIILSITAAFAKMGYWAIVIRQLTIPIVTMVAAWILCPWRPGRPGNFSTAVPGLKYAVKVYSNFSIGYLNRSIDKVLLGKFHGSELLGNYDRAYHLSSMPAGQILTPLHSVALSTLSRLQNDKERFLSYYTKAVSMVAFLGTIAAVGLTLSARDLIPLLLGQEWVEAGSVVMAFGPGIAAMLVYGTHSWLHLSLGTPGRWLRWNLVDAVSSIVAFVIAAPFGAIAMAIAYSARSFVLIIPALWYAGRPVSLDMVRLLRSIGVYFSAGIFVVSGWFYLIITWLPFTTMIAGFSPLIRIALTLFISSFLYITLVIIFQRSFASIIDIFSLMKILLSREKTGIRPNETL